MLVFTVALALSGFAQDAAPQAPTGAAVQTPAPAAAPAEEPNERERMVCRRERVVGSNRPQRICMTQAQWDATRDQSRERFNEVTRGQPERLPVSAM